MRFLLLISSLIAICFPLCFAADWAVIIAGSNTFDNYRHQADTCHSYHIVRKFGIPDSQIITLMHDDIASDPSNPFPGKVFNKPAASLAAAVDVYKGCKIDYRGGDVNAANFLAVLTGNSTAVPTGKPVLKSTASDRVFVNFVDHGGSGILGMPNDEDYLYANDLITALKTMHTKKMYSKLVFYLEACESGSMFENILPANLNIYATTAANADESSWGDYCSPDDTIGGTEVGSCLGDLYSTNWMENSDAAGEAETLMTQMKIVTAETTQSHVSQYGTLSFRNLPIGDFQGNLNRPSRSLHRSLGGKSSTLVNTRDIPLHNKYSRYLRASSGSSPSELTEKALNELNAELASRKFVDSLFDQLARKLAASNDSSFFFAPPQKSVIVGTQCQKNVDHAIKQFCGSRNEYMMKYHRVVVNACHQTDDATIINHLKEVCTSLKPHAVQF